MKKIILLILLIFLILFLTSCSLFVKEKIVYSSIYPSLPPLQEPNVLSLTPCEFTYPLIKDEKVFVGLDEENFKCYIENKEIIREQLKLYHNFTIEVNEERKKWNELNISNKK